MWAGLTLSIPGGHGDDPVDPGLSHGADHSLHGQGVARHGREEGGREAEAGHDHILSFEVTRQTVRGEDISLHHLEADKESEGGEQWLDSRLLPSAGPNRQTGKQANQAIFRGLKSMSGWNLVQLDWVYRACWALVEVHSPLRDILPAVCCCFASWIISIFPFSPLNSCIFMCLNMFTEVYLTMTPGSLSLLWCRITTTSINLRGGLWLTPRNIVCASGFSSCDPRQDTIHKHLSLTELWAQLRERSSSNSLSQSHSTVKHTEPERQYLEIIMVDGQFSRVPDDGGDRVTLLQRLVDQKLPSLPSGSQHSDLHPQSLTSSVRAEAVECSDLLKSPRGGSRPVSQHQV